ncbi:MAG: hypothetical protein L3J18_05170 [Candidatus Brocadia sp.]|uniref:Uncharacterized protein n=1 Tax=Candidatus Brocadia fulgida TaxID=380242 RepID=A0A0M2UUP6_9BACT|nr:MAG: hypothetical protein BROFUL_01521 [Candidatus Brocadia fulgida]UJS21701.1 MAG: hypothetical protein L3J18_05170 [Candidatus Brocadia sp.]
MRRFRKIFQNARITRPLSDSEVTVNEMTKAVRFKGHEVFEVKRINQTDWGISIQKRDGVYSI